MNRVEAIKILKAAQTDNFPYDPGLLVKAMDMAISSLETDEAYQLEYEQPEFCEEFSNGVMWMLEQLDNAPTVDSIPRECIEQMVAEIERKANSGQWSEATVYGMKKAVAIIHKYTKEQNNDLVTQTISDSLVAFSKQIVGDYEKEQNNVD